MINITNLSLAFGEKNILKNVTWQITDRSKIGLVGDNGVGKTTLLSILAELTEPDDGTVEFIPPTTVGYLPQDLAELGFDPVMEFLRQRAGVSVLKAELEAAAEKISQAAPDSQELKSALAAHERAERDFAHKSGYEFEATAEKVLCGLGFKPGDSSRLCSEFSGGWRMRLALAALLLAKPEVLLLDEPTNHLDTESMEWLEGWLRDHRGILIFVSHDRRFLGKMASQIAELSHAKITVYPMDYESYLNEREAVRLRREKTIAQQTERIEEINRFVERFRYKATKATQVQSRLKQLEKMDIIEADAPESSVNIRFPEASRSGYDVITAKSLAKSYGTLTVFDNLDFEIKRGERVALVGVNGAGKSTLLRLLSGTEAPDSGSVCLGHNVRRAYYSQESSQNLVYSHTVWEEACNTGSRLTEAEKRNLLGCFLFSGNDIHKSIGVLSGGEKSRVALFKLLLSDSNFLILDEPTNHLDMKTKAIFQNALLQYGGTLLIVSHDRYFLDSLIDRVVEIRDGRLYNYPGNYSYFVAKRDEQLKADFEPGNKKPKDAPPAPLNLKERRRDEAEERNKLYRKRKDYLDRLESLEKRIFTREERRREIDALLTDPEFLRDSSEVGELMKERAKIEISLTDDYAAWEKLSETIDSIK